MRILEKSVLASAVAAVLIASSPMAFARGGHDHNGGVNAGVNRSKDNPSYEEREYCSGRVSDPFCEGLTNG